MKCNRLNIAMIFASALLGVTSCGGRGDGNRTSGEADSLTAVAELRQRLEEADKSGKVLFGHHDDPVYGHEWCADSGRSDVLETAGDYPAVMSWDLGGLELGNAANLDGVDFGRMRAEVAAQNARGGISTFSWHLYNPVDSSDCWTIGDSTTVARILTDAATGKAFEKDLDYLADFFTSLRDADGEKIAVIFRPWHEHTGNWFWWGRPFCTPEQYRQLWEVTRRGLEKRGVDNVLYAYSPDRISSEEEYMERYPGDEYVEILGADVYHFNGEKGVEGYKTTAANQLAIVRKLADERGKIAAFTETGSEGLPMADWYTSVLLPVLKAQPVSYVVVWRNAHDRPGHFYAPYPGHPAEESFKTFYND